MAVKGFAGSSAKLKQQSGTAASATATAAQSAAVAAATAGLTGTAAAVAAAVALVAASQGHAPATPEERAFAAVVDTAREAAATVMRAKEQQRVAAGQPADLAPDSLQHKLLVVEMKAAAAAAALEAAAKAGLSAADGERAVRWVCVCTGSLFCSFRMRVLSRLVCVCSHLSRSHIHCRDPTCSCIHSEAMKTDTKTRAQEAAKKLQARMGMAVAASSGSASGSAASAAAGGEEPTFYSTEIEINDYPQNARWKVSNKVALDDLMERHECVIYLKGIHVAAGKKAPDGERKLYLTVEGRTVMAVRNAKADIRRTLEEAALMARPDNAGRSAPGRFDMGAGTLRLM